MRILVINKYWRPLGGVEVHVADVVNFLTELGHEVIPFAMDEPETADSEFRRYFPSKVEFRASGFSDRLRSVERSALSTETVSKLESLLDSEHIDAAYVVHVYHQLGTRVLNVLKRHDIPMVMSIHDYKIGCPNYRLYSERTGKICTKCTDSPSGKFWAPITEKCWSGSAAAGLALVAEAAATSLRNSYTKPNVVVTLNKIQDDMARKVCGPDVIVRRIPHPVTLHPEVPDDDRQNHVLYVGRLVPEKGVDVLIRACAKSGLALRVVGDGRDREALEALALQGSNDVTFVGSLPPHEIQNEMRTAKCLAVPSIWHEVSPLVVLEAIANALPVVASRVGGMVDQLSEERGFLVEPSSVNQWAETLSAVMTDRGSRHVRSSNARRYAEINWSRSAWSDNFKGAFQSAGVLL